MMGESYLGNVFISHSSLDKPFVRRLDRRLRGVGYQTWLDEHKIIAGDALASRIAEGVREAKVVLVVVSRKSIASKWLKYELNIATERMINGQCRVIPIVIGDAELPKEVLGLLYADFRNGFGDGFRSVRTALQHEDARIASSASFWVVAPEIIRTEFGGSGHVSLDTEYIDRDYAIVTVETNDRKGRAKSLNVVYTTIAAYGQPAPPLTESWWDEFSSSMEAIPERLALIVTQRPVAFEAARPDPTNPQVSYRQLMTTATPLAAYGYAVFADCSGLPRDKWPEVVNGSRREVERLAKKTLRLKQRPAGATLQKKLSVWIGLKDRRRPRSS